MGSHQYRSALVANYLHIALSAVSALAVVPILLSHTGTELTGVFFLLWALTNFANLGNAWLINAAIILMTESDLNGDRSTFQAIHRTVFFTMIGLAFAVLAMSFFAVQLTGKFFVVDAPVSAIEDIKNSIGIVAATIGLMYVASADIAALTSTLRQFEVSIFRIISQIVFLLGIAISWATSSITVSNLLLGQFFGCLVVTAACRWLVTRSGNSRLWGPAPARSEALRSQLFQRYGAPLFAASCGQMVFAHADLFILGAFLGADAVARYGILCRIPDLLALLFGRAAELMSPYFSRLHAADRVAVRSLYLGASAHIHLVCLVSAVCYGILGESALKIWIGRSVPEFTRFSLFLAGVAILTAVTNRIDAVLHTATGAARSLVGIQIAEAVCRVLLTIILLECGLGLLSPLWAVLAGQACLTFWLYRQSASRLVDSSLSQWWQALRLSLVWVAGILAVAIAFVEGVQVCFPGNSTWWDAVIVLCALAGVLGVSRYADQRSGLDRLPNLLKRAGSVSLHHRQTPPAEPVA